MFDTSNPNNRPSSSIPSWVISIILLSITGVICYKVIITPFNLQFDFPSLLSLLLALFSVALAALFYFKATDTSNAFYDNTYKFTQEIAGLLVKIESGFGEKLTHLDDAYKGMRDQFDRLPRRIELKETKEELRQEEAELTKIIEDKDQIINDLIDKAELKNGERERILGELKSKDDAYREAQEEIAYLNRRLSDASERQSWGEYVNSFMPKGDTNVGWTVLYENYPDMGEDNIINKIIYQLGGAEKVLQTPPDILKREVRRLLIDYSPKAVKKLRLKRIIDDKGNLDIGGVEYLMRVAKELYSARASYEDRSER
jgi:hypothetical protein